MDKEPPVVSVIIPAYNRGHCLENAIRSAWKQEGMDGHIEIIVVDDASTDDTPSLLSKLCAEIACLQVIRHEENRGVSAARNTGIRASRGEFIAFLDSDDTWHPMKLNVQLDEMVSPELQDFIEKTRLGKPTPDDFPAERLLEPFTTFYLTYFGCMFDDGNIAYGEPFTEEKDEIDLSNPKIYSEEELHRGVVTWNIWLGPGSTLLAHRKAIEKNGFFNEKLGCGEDTEYVLRHILNGSKIKVTSLPLTIYTLPEPSKRYAHQEVHYQYMADTYRCRVAERFGPEVAREFLDNLRKSQISRTPIGQDWRDAVRELTVPPDAPCESGFNCSLIMDLCHRPHQSHPLVQINLTKEFSKK